MFQGVDIDIFWGVGHGIFWPNIKANMHYNSKWFLINAMREANSTMRIQEESRRHLKAWVSEKGALML